VLSYGLDAVGNRQSLASSVTGIGAQSANYDNNDRVVGVSYDDNGNMQGAVGTANVYDSQDRLKSFNNGAVTMVYDGDGNRVSKTAGGVTTNRRITITTTGWWESVTTPTGICRGRAGQRTCTIRRTG